MGLADVLPAQLLTLSQFGSLQLKSFQFQTALGLLKSLLETGWGLM